MKKSDQQLQALAIQHCERTEETIPLRTVKSDTQTYSSLPKEVVTVMSGDAGRPNTAKVHFDVAEAETVPLTAAVQSTIDPLNTGFYLYTPPLADDKQRSTNGHEWTISGHDMQVFTTTVPPGDQVVTEVGSMMFMAPFMETEVEMTLCTSGGFVEGCDRICGGESCVKVFYKNNTGEPGFVGLTPPFPGKILPIKFGTHVAANEPLIAQRGAYMAELGDIDVGKSLLSMLYWE